MTRDDVPEIPPLSDADAPSNVLSLPNAHRIALPASLEAEREALAAVLVDESTALPVLADRLSPEQLYWERHQLVYDAMLSLAASGSPVDPVTLSQRLRDRGDWERVGGARIVGELLDRSGLLAHLGHYCDIIRDKWAHRRFVAYAESVRSLGLDENWDTDEILQQLDHLHRDLVKELSTARAAAGTAVAMGDAHRDMLERSKATVAQGGTLAFPFGFRPLDDALGGGAWRGETTMILGEPGHGKSTILGQFAQVNSRASRRGVLLQAEMPRGQVYGRQVAQLSGVPFHIQRSGKMTHSQEVAVYEAMSLLDEWPLHVEVTKGRDVDRVARHIRAIGREYGGLDWIGLDYAQKMPTGQRDGVSALEHISTTWSGLGAELDAASLMLVQPTKREPEGPPPWRRPTMQSARGAQAFVADADVFLVVHRPWFSGAKGVMDKYEVSKDQQRNAIVAIDKLREGEAAGLEIKCRFNGARMRFEEGDWC